jgi:glyoxylase I family protein
MWHIRHRGGLQAWADWLDSRGVAHSGIQSREESFVYSPVVFRDIDDIQPEVIAVDV